MSNTVYIVDIEAVDTRYTAQWKKYLPDQLQKALMSDTILIGEVEVISGGEVPQATTPGAFINFGGTNVYKSNQLLQIAELFCSGKVNDGEYFLYTDAWNPSVIQLKYMSELLGIKVHIGGMWHAGSYDPQDFLGRLIGEKPWVRNAELSMFDCYDHNYFATDFHVELFKKTFGNKVDDDKIHVVGWPMEYLEQELKPYMGLEKENIILFPHRIAPEKQPEIFRDLAAEFPDYKFIVCQDEELTKDEYHTLLGKAKMVFSANLQETLGISAYEGALVGAMPIVPNRLSYTEMYPAEAKYPSNITENFESYLKNKNLMIAKINDVMHNNSTYHVHLPEVLNKVTPFFSGQRLYDTIKKAIVS